MLLGLVHGALDVLDKGLTYCRAVDVGCARDGGQLLNELFLLPGMPVEPVQQGFRGLASLDGGQNVGDFIVQGLDLGADRGAAL
ncbi:MAG TPA: hypothetical protein PLO90_00385 [Clostridia bacterium]|nr:hypothetical protein [Clostridia bacterium]HQO56108.1 hypothetical protein [Clostridia bacterium]HUM60718.1 hypothetical protein [Clostridia bacterium]